MIFADTPVWIQFFRGQEEMLVAEVREHLDEENIALSVPVWIELLGGAKRSERKLLRTTLAALPRYYPSRNTWKKMEEWIDVAEKEGKRFGMADLLIAAICSENNGRIWSSDQDFSRMADLKFIKLY